MALFRGFGIDVDPLALEAQMIFEALRLRFGRGTPGAALRVTELVGQRGAFLRRYGLSLSKPAICSRVVTRAAFGAKTVMAMQKDSSFAASANSKAMPWAAS